MQLGIFHLKKIAASKAREEAEELKQDCGVETLFYKETNDEHEGLVDIVNEIAKECNIKIPSTAVSQDPSNNNDRSGDEQSKPIADESDNRLDRIKQMSQDMARRIGDED